MNTTADFNDGIGRTANADACRCRARAAFVAALDAAREMVGCGSPNCLFVTDVESVGGVTVHCRCLDRPGTARMLGRLFRAACVEAPR